MQLEIDSTGDLIIENNEFQLIDGYEEIKQLLTSRLKTFYGEYFLDVTYGIPYYQTILEKGINPSILYNIFTKVIVETDGITELNKLNIDYDKTNRTCILTFDVKTEDGRLVFTLPLGVE